MGAGLQSLGDSLQFVADCFGELAGPGASVLGLCMLCRSEFVLGGCACWLLLNCLGVGRGGPSVLVGVGFSPLCDVVESVWDPPVSMYARIGGPVAG